MCDLYFYHCTLVKLWLHVKWNYFGIILKLFHCFISHVTTSETEIKIIPGTQRLLKLFQNYFRDTERVGK